MTKPKWLQLCMLLVASLLFNNAFATPAKYTRHATEQVQQVNLRQQVATLAFVQTLNKPLYWYDSFGTKLPQDELAVSTALKRQQLLCLNISQAPPVLRLLLPQKDEPYALS